MHADGVCGSCDDNGCSDDGRPDDLLRTSRGHVHGFAVCHRPVVNWRRELRVPLERRSGAARLQRARMRTLCHAGIVKSRVLRSVTRVRRHEYDRPWPRGRVKSAGVRADHHATHRVLHVAAAYCRGCGVEDKSVLQLPPDGVRQFSLLLHHR